MWKDLSDANIISPQIVTDLLLGWTYVNLCAKDGNGQCLGQLADITCEPSLCNHYPLGRGRINNYDISEAVMIFHYKQDIGEGRLARAAILGKEHFAEIADCNGSNSIFY